MKIHGTDIHLAWRSTTTGPYTEFAYSRSCALEFKRDKIECTSPASRADKAFLPGRSEWNMSVDCLFSDDEEAVIAAAQAGTIITVRMYTGGTKSNPHEFVGNAFITGYKLTGRIHDLATFVISLQGTNALDYHPIS